MDIFRLQLPLLNRMQSILSHNLHGGVRNGVNAARSGGGTDLRVENHVTQIFMHVIRLSLSASLYDPAGLEVLAERSALHTFYSRTWRT